MKHSLLSLLVLPLSAQVVSQPGTGSARTSIARTPTGSILEIHDPGNHVWDIQTSSDLDHWQSLQTTRVFNGRLAVPLTHAVSGTVFFRFNSSTTSSFASTIDQATVLPATVDNYAILNLPAHLSTPAITAQDNQRPANPVTNAGATLGRMLFYDKRLSANQTVSCSSCHQPEHGFSDPGRFSVGFEGGLTSRNSMGLTNARYYLRGNFFWDERAATLEEQVLQPIQNPVEMGMNLNDLVTRISAEPFYPPLFQNAFGSTEVNSTRISRALAQFIRSIVSSSSKYDLGVASNFSNFTAQENAGRNLFNGPARCATCHGSDNFVPGNAIFNNGLENPYSDKGLAEITGRSTDEGLFKVPSLRNIELTAPYMHDGRFATLEQVVDFYNNGITSHPNLSPPLRTPNGQVLRLNLNPDQKAALVAFLKTLTDTSVTSDPRFSDPFRYSPR